MEHIRTLLPAVLKKRGLHEHAIAALVIHHANLWIGQKLPAMRNELTARAFTNTVLVIAAAHSTAAQECQQAATELITHLKHGIPEAGLTDVRIVRE
ncbi:MAG: DciA family protein [Candidatus Peribacteraceae bacterium]|jgi:hypothetical protein